MLQPSQIRGLLRATWGLAIMIVVIGSLLPGDSAPIRTLDLLHVNDKIQHCAAYAVLAFLPAIHEKRGFLAVAAIGAVALGIGLEYGQLYSGWRDFEIGDMVADAVGVCFGLAVGIPMRSAGFVRSILPSPD